MCLGYEFRIPKDTPGIFVRGGICLSVTSDTPPRSTGVYESLLPNLIKVNDDFATFQCLEEQKEKELQEELKQIASIDPDFRRAPEIDIASAEDVKRKGSGDTMQNMSRKGSGEQIQETAPDEGDTAGAYLSIFMYYIQVRRKQY